MKTQLRLGSQCVTSDEFVLFFFLPLSGQPSLCYVFEGDGVCEEFEKGSSIQDCGFFTPQGFNDQWASTASGSHQDQRCPASRVTGEPALTQVNNHHPVS